MPETLNRGECSQQLSYAKLVIVMATYGHYPCCDP